MYNAKTKVIEWCDLTFKKFREYSSVYYVLCVWQVNGGGRGGGEGEERGRRSGGRKGSVTDDIHTAHHAIT